MPEKPQELDSYYRKMHKNKSNVAFSIYHKFKFQYSTLFFIYIHKSP